MSQATLYYHMNIILLLFNIFTVGQTSSLQLLDLQVPQLVLAGGYAELSCRWQFDPGELLYSVKWYKDGNEFLRYVPKDLEPRKVFILPGVTIKVFGKSGSKIVLSHVELTTSGRYRCEVSGERPYFLTVSEYRDMVVVVPPQTGPIISGFRSKYRIGEKVEINCTCGPSRPATHLAWYINGETINMENFHYTEGEMITSRMALNFAVERKHFTKNGLKIKCLATIPPVYWKSAERGASLERITIGTTTSKADYIRSDSPTKIMTDFKTLIINLVIFISIQ